MKYHGYWLTRLDIGVLEVRYTAKLNDYDYKLLTDREGIEQRYGVHLLGSPIQIRQPLANQIWNDKDLTVWFRTVRLKEWREREEAIRQLTNKLHLAELT